MSNRNARVVEVAKHLGVSWYQVDKFTKNGVLPCDRIVVNSKVARLYSKGECEQYFFIYHSLIDSGVARIAALRGVRHRQQANKVRNSFEMRGFTAAHKLPVDSQESDYRGSENDIGRINVTSEAIAKGEDAYPVYIAEPEATSKKLFFIIAMLILLVIVVVLGVVLFANQ